MNNAPSPLLLRLPDDAARVVTTLLTYCDLERLTGVSRASSRDSFFQATRDTRERTLTLPYTPFTTALVLRGIGNRNPARLLSMVEIRIFASWQAELLVGLDDIAVQVTSVRVESLDKRDTGTEIRAICELLARLPRLVKLDVSDTPLDAVDTISAMSQLRELNLSRTLVVDASPLAALAELEVLVMEDVNVVDMRCIENMTRLQVLKVGLRKDESKSRRGSDPVSIYIPTMRGLSELHTLELRQCEILNTADLLHVASQLKQLTLVLVFAREPTLLDDQAWPPRDVNQDELVARMKQLEIVEIRDSHEVLSGASSTLARIPSLRSINHAVDEDLQSLGALVNLRELELWLPEGDYADFAHREVELYGALLQMAQLTKLKIQQTTSLPWHWLPDMEEIHDQLVQVHATTLTHALTQISQLKELHYQGYIPSDDFFRQLTSLDSLSLGSCTPELSTLSWITSYKALRSLDVVVPSPSCDLSGIGELLQLEDLRLCFQKGHKTQFLYQLRQLKKLELTGDVDDLSGVRGLTSLKELTIQSRVRLPNLEPLSTLTHLEVLDVRHTKIKNLSPLGCLPTLRTVVIPTNADCRPLVSGSCFKLLRILHPDRNCIPNCHHRKHFEPC